MQDGRDLPDPSERAAALVRSACSSDVRRARELLEADPTLARHDIACACVTGEAEEVARLLHAAPALARAPAPPLGHEPILYACFTRLARADPAVAPGIRAVVGLLLRAGADPNASFDHDGWLQVPLYGAAGIANDAELTRMLLDAGADPNDTRDPDDIGEALYHACEFPDPTCAELIVRAGARPHVLTRCIGRALKFPDPAMVAMLCAHGGRADAGHLHQAVQRRRPPDTVGVLLDAGAPIDEPDENGLTALRIATRWGQGDTVALLLGRGADATVVGDEDRALGAFLAETSTVVPTVDLARLDEMLNLAVQAGDLRLVRRLLDVGARVDGDPDAVDVPLGQAAWRGHPDVVRELVARGARLQFADGSAIGAALHGRGHCQHPEGGPTMRIAEEVPRRPYAEVVSILLAAGAPVPALRWKGAPSARDLIAQLGVELPA